MGAILSFDDYKFQVRVSGLPYQDGSAWVYECYVIDGSQAAYIPGEFLLPGRQVSRIGSAYEEVSVQLTRSTAMRLISSTIRLRLRCVTTSRLSV